MLTPIVPLLFSFTALASAAEQAYPRGDMLVEASSIAKPQAAFRVLDARSKANYGAGHIPGATWVNHGAWSKSFYAKQDPKEWAKTIGALGIDNRTRVLVYDDGSITSAARIWYILRYWGVRDARLLNGGFPAYAAAKLPLATEDSIPSSTQFAIRAPVARRFADKEKVLDVLKNKSAQIIDTRSEGEYCGLNKLLNNRGGAIPGALHLEWSDALDKRTHKFKPAAELAKLLRDAGIDLGKPAITHCQSGGRAAVMAFTLELMGGRDIANYYRGWSEWGSTPELPIVRPEPKR